MASSGRITESVFKVSSRGAVSIDNMLNAHQAVSGILFSIAIIAAITRTVIRFRLRRRLLLDDYLLGFACVCLIAADILLYKTLPVLYLIEELSFDPASVTLPAGFLQQVSPHQKMIFSYVVMAWSVIYLVKFCFLYLFRLLIDRLKGLVRYWWFVVGITAISSGICICYEFIVCPRFGFSGASGFIWVSSKRLWDLLLTLNSAMSRKFSHDKEFRVQRVHCLFRYSNRSNELSGSASLISCSGTYRL